MILSSLRRPTLPVADTARRVSRLTVALINQTPGGVDTSIGGQVDVAGYTNHVDAIQFDGVNKVFQNTWIPGGTVDIRHSKSVGFAPSQ